MLFQQRSEGGRRPPSVKGTKGRLEAGTTNPVPAPRVANDVAPAIDAGNPGGANPQRHDPRTCGDHGARLRAEAPQKPVTES